MSTFLQYVHCKDALLDCSAPGGERCESLTWVDEITSPSLSGDTSQWRHNGHDGISNHQPHDCLLNRLFRRRSKKTSKLRVTGLCAGNSPVTGEFPAQMASNAENVSIWWRHHERQDPPPLTCPPRPLSSPPPPSSLGQASAVPQTSYEKAILRKTRFFPFLENINTHIYIYVYQCDSIRNGVSSIYCQTSTISHTWVGNKIAYHSDVVGALPVGAAPTTSSFLT